MNAKLDFEQVWHIVAIIPQFPHRTTSRKMNSETIKFLRSAYKNYYFHNSERVETPKKIAEREFGYIPFGGGMLRHLSFKNHGEFVAEVVRQAPSSIYCSNATYDAPASPMEEKGWKGAELIFDIDANDIPTSCKKEHDMWFCHDCMTAGRLPKPPRCTNSACSGAKIEALHNVCKICLDAAKEHAIRLTNILMEDFDVEESSIRTYFSGNRGYHLHVYDARFESLNVQARMEIAEHVRGTEATNTIPKAFFIKLRKYENTRQGFSGYDYGWLGRVKSSFITEVSKVDVDMSKRTNVRAATIKRIIADRVALIDPSVTSDIHRVFRMAGTLHGSTGMLKVRVDSFEDFDALADPVVLGEDKVKITIKYSPQFFLRGEKFGAFKSQTVEMPTYAAVYTLARGLGEVN